MQTRSGFVLPTVDEYALRPEQEIRVTRMQDQPLYLISIEDNDTFKISGSTANLYTVTVNRAATTPLQVAKCTCPDAGMHAKHNNVLCKHCCFVLLKALRLPKRILEQPPHLGQLTVALASLRSRNWGHLSNEAYQEKYRQYIAGGNDGNSNPFSVPEDAEITDNCAICLDEMTATVCVRCPGCRQYFHSTCISIWLAVRNDYQPKPCPLCRTSWAEYDKKNNGVPGAIINLEWTV